MQLEELQTKSKGPQDYILFVDLDGVLVDFTKGVDRLLGGYNEQRYESDPKYRSQMWKAVGQYQKNGGEFWYELDPMPDAKTLWNYVVPYDPQILTATGNSGYNAGEQKRRWVAKYLGSDIRVNLTRSAAEKAQFAGKNHILIDDKKKAIDPWEAAGGIGILHTSAANTIAQLKKLGL